MQNEPTRLILPKTYLSYSQMILWIKNPIRYRKEYFEDGKKLDTKYLRYGSSIHEMIENGTYKELLPDLVVYDKNEFEVRVDINGVPTFSIIDSYNEELNVFRDTKTGKIPWTKQKVYKSQQLVFYATVLKKLKGKTPEYAHLDWIQTQEGGVEVEDFWRSNEKQINVTGYVKPFQRDFDEREITKMEELIVKVANEISDAYQAFLKEI